MIFKINIVLSSLDFSKNYMFFTYHLFFSDYSKKLLISEHLYQHTTLYFYFGIHQALLVKERCHMDNVRRFSVIMSSVRLSIMVALLLMEMLKIKKKSITITHEWQLLKHGNYQYCSHIKK